jgi:RNA polymerase sigma factor (sigma-70 family)
LETTLPDHAGDLHLARRIARNDLDAWHEFVLRYSALIRSLVRRYYFGWSGDEQLNLYVTVLEQLRSRHLRRYDGRAALSTWVIVVTRSCCVDALRRELGRHRPPRWIRDRPPIEQDIYRLHFVELMPLPAMLAALRLRGHAVNTETLEGTVESLAARLDRPSRRRLAYELRARTVGARSGRQLEILDEVRRELEDRATADHPDQVRLREDTYRRLRALEACVHRLEAPERRAIELRFYERKTAPDIARSMNLPGARQAYRLVERGIARLRRMLAPGSRSSGRSSGHPPSSGCGTEVMNNP